MGSFPMKNWPILKKFDPTEARICITANKSRGQKSKIWSHMFVQNIKCFPKWYDTTHCTNNHGGDAFLVHGLIRGQAEAVLPAPEIQWKSCLHKKVFKFEFRGVYLMKNWPILKKYMTHLAVPACLTQRCGSRCKIKNLFSYSHIMVCLVKCFPKWYDTTQ